MEKEICIEESGNAMEKLKACNPEYCFLGITADGGKCHSVPAPWDSTVACMNMKLPDVFLSPEDIRDPEIREMLKQIQVRSVFIFVPLEEYTFLADFPALCQLYIFFGKNLKDLSFLVGRDSVSQLYIEDADLEDISTLGRLKKAGLQGMCFGLYNASVKDLSPLLEYNGHFTEIQLCKMRRVTDEMRNLMKKLRVGRYCTLQEADH